MSLGPRNGPVGCWYVVPRAALAPFIVDDILAGRQPVHLTAGQIRQAIHGVSVVNMTREGGGNLGNIDVIPSRREC